MMDISSYSIFVSKVKGWDSKSKHDVFWFNACTAIYQLLIDGMECMTTMEHFLIRSNFDIVFLNKTAATLDLLFMLQSKKAGMDDFSHLALSSSKYASTRS